MNLLVLSIIVLINALGQIEKGKSDVQFAAMTEIPLPGVTGRIDHLAFNDKQGLLYVAALGNNSVEVVNLKERRVIHSIKGLEEPQGIRYIPETNSIFVANGGNGVLKVYDGSTYQELKSVKVGEDADNVRYDPSTKTVYVGYGEGAIAGFDAITVKQTLNIELPGHPESFQLDTGNKLFVNIPGSHLLDVIDLRLNKITERWEISEATANFPLALDKADHRLFIGCRRPAKLLVLDTNTGKIISACDADGDTDDIFFDSITKQLYMSCGSGYVDVFKESGPDKYEIIGRIETSPGARTSLFIPELNQLVVAAPARSGKGARLIVYGQR